MMEIEEAEIVMLAAEVLPSAVAAGRSAEDAVKYAFRLAEAFAKEVVRRETPEMEKPVIEG